MTIKQASKVISEFDRVLLEGLLGGFVWSATPTSASGIPPAGPRRGQKFRDVEVEVVETKRIEGGK